MVDFVTQDPVSPTQVPRKQRGSTLCPMALFPRTICIIAYLTDSAEDAGAVGDDSPILRFSVQLELSTAVEIEIAIQADAESTYPP